MSGEPDTFWCHGCRRWTVVCDGDEFCCDRCGDEYLCDECGALIERDGTCTRESCPESA